MGYYLTEGKTLHLGAGGTEGAWERDGELAGSGRWSWANATRNPKHYG